MTDGFEGRVQAIHARIRAYREAGKRVFATSSFQTQSLPLLHILSGVLPNVPVYFLNTGYLFPETVAFKDAVASQLGLEVIDQRPLVPKSLQRNGHGELYFTSDPDLCCYLNKVQPLEPVLAAMGVWVSGVRATQSAARRTMADEEDTAHGLRYHPLIEWCDAMIEDYIVAHGLPRHPLEAAGYRSVGCEPCTRPSAPGPERAGRWAGLEKTECGLHTQLRTKRS